MLTLLAPLPVLSILATVCAPAAAATASDGAPPRVLETRTYRIRQTVALKDVPAGSKEVRLWVPVPADGAWQRVLDRRVVEAPAGWRLEKQPVSDAEMVVVSAKGASN